MSLPTLALPGQPLGAASKYAPGPGIHIQDAQLCASLLGPVSETKPLKRAAAGASTTTSSMPALSITRPQTGSSAAVYASIGASNILPEVDSIVLARVTRLTPRQATVEILVVGETVCREGFQGIIRREDVRATEKDRVKIGDMFRVGDIVRGVVISLGDQQNYYLSTATNELGVVMARSEAENQMYPISWKEFRDPKTGMTESRKVAKPF
ncbi:Exosome complex component csl4 [Lasiodiplodia hormozganensis]|uniref:Exosome complex component csl4 n=1 Tax=Lasiodiplodia hormozganensis TaxID=869390 RepID=A0AA40D8A4_9PEZI|nr:Exosome complex component csl4 [Lasiodiplodia hormozganensis]